MDNYFSEINELYKIISDLKRNAMKELTLKNIELYEDRIPYEYIDMSNIYSRLINIVKFIDNNYSSLLSCDEELPSFKNKILKVYLAGVCSMIKQEFYEGHTTEIYKRITGIDHLNNYYNLLKEAFEFEGILPENWEARKGKNRYKDVLINESGIPVYLASNIINFFRIYHKYFKDTSFDDKKKFVFDFEKHENYQFEYKDYKKMKLIYKKIKNYPTKVLNILYDLEKVHNYIQDNNFGMEDINDEFFEQANKDLNFDILAILPRKNSLMNLYKDIANKVTLAKFIKIMNNKPNNLNIILPNGREILNKHYKYYMYGEHNFLGVEYIVLPDTSFDLKDIFSIELNNIHKVGSSKFVYTSKNSFKIQKGFDELESKKIIFEGNSLYVWVDYWPRGRPIIIDDKKVKPKELVYWNPSIKYRWDQAKKKYKLYAYIPLLRIYNKDFRHKEVKIICNASSYVIKEFFDQNGYYSKEFVSLELNNIYNVDKIKVSIVLVESKENIFTKTLSIKEIYLFDKTTHELYKPGEHTTVSGDMLLFIKNNLDVNDSLIVYEYKDFHNYKVYKLTFNNNNKSMTINKFKWDFKNINKLYFKKNFNNKKSSSSDFSSNIINSISDIKLEVVTNIEEKDYKDIFIIVEKESRRRQYNFNSVIQNSDGQLILRQDVINEDFNYLNNFIGEWLFSLYFKGKKYHTIVFQLVPEITVSTCKDIYKEGEQVDALLNSSIPFFCNNIGDKLEDSKKVRVGKARIKEQENHLVSEEIKEYIYLPSLKGDKKISIKPEVWCVRIRDENKNKLLKLSSLPLTHVSDLVRYKLIVYTDIGGFFGLYLNDVSSEIYCNAGLNYFSLDDYKTELREVNTIKIVHGNQNEKIVLKWETFFTAPFIVKKGNELYISINCIGPAISSYRLVISGSNGVIEQFKLNSDKIEYEKNILLDLKKLENEDTINFYIDHLHNKRRIKYKIDLRLYKDDIEKITRETLMKYKQYDKIYNIFLSNSQGYTRDNLIKDIYNYVKVANKTFKDELIF